MFTIEGLIRDDKVCTEHIHLMVIAFIELARADRTLDTLQGTQDADIKKYYTALTVV